MSLFSYVCWLVFQYYATWVAVTCPRRELRQWGWPLALLPTAPCLYYAVQLGYHRSFFKAFLAAFGLYPLFLCLKSLSRCKDSHKFEEVQVVYAGMSIMPSLALYGSILLPGPLGSWSAEWMQYRVDPQVVLDEESLRRSPFHEPDHNQAQRSLDWLDWAVGWRTVNAFDAEEWDASYSLLEFLSQLWGWENVIVLAVCYITDRSNILVVLSCLGGFVLERLLRECLDLTLKNNTREEGARTDNPPLTEALLSA
ncbi:hypothetical protein FOZ61_008318 [Perkinsus olseni]|uniref:Uncharacterized protein n=1 Tax=Perkinsus olseni TaxID=32597 RepID=A0A7J6L5A8_PEROL|nr:hypothetical protein FOZ61_008318 [Perkinsus olseni]